MKKTILAIALAAGLTSFAGNAKAGITYNFTFKDTYDSSKSVSGALTLNDAGTQAESVFITSAPFSYDSSFNWVNNDTTHNSFIVSNGLISAADFVGLGAKYDLIYGPSVYGLVLGAEGFDEYHLSGNDLVNDITYDFDVYNFDGLDGITFTPLTSGGDPAAVPEPSQVAASLLLAAGIAGFVIVKRRKEASELEVLAA
jgi:hypothetical protein